MSTVNAHAPLDVSRPDIIPGFTLSQPRFTDYAVVEQILERNWSTGVIASATAAGPEALRAAVEYVGEAAKARIFAYGRPLFDQWVGASGILPTLLFLCVRIRHPQVTGEQAAALITDENRQRVREAVLALWGYETKKQEPPAGGASGTETTSTTAPPTTPESAKPSAAGDTSPATLPA